MKRKFFLALLVAILMLGLVACSSNNLSQKTGKNDEMQGYGESKDIVVTDMLGRNVEIPVNPKKFVNVGVGALRLYTYVAPPR